MADEIEAMTESELASAKLFQEQYIAHPLPYEPEPLIGPYEDEATRMCTCLHRLHHHMAAPVGCRWTGGEQECSCSKFERRHSETLRENCWCMATNLAPEHPSEVEGAQPRYIQMALDSVRTQLDLLTLQLADWGNTEDLNARVENWLFNTKRTMDEILKTG